MNNHSVTPLVSASHPMWPSVSGVVSPVIQGLPLNQSQQSLWHKFQYIYIYLVQRKHLQDFRNHWFHLLLASTLTMWLSVSNVLFSQCHKQPFAHLCIHYSSISFCCICIHCFIPSKSLHLLWCARGLKVPILGLLIFKKVTLMFLVCFHYGSEIWQFPLSHAHFLATVAHWNAVLFVARATEPASPGILAL